MKKLIIATLLLYACFTVRGALLTWDSNPSLPGAQDGSGNWNTGFTNWLGGGWVNSSSDTAIFGSGSGAAGTVTLVTGITAGALTFNAAGSGNYTVTGNTLTLAGAPVITTNVSATISSLLAGTAGFTKSGTGTLNLQAGINGQSNSLTGAVTLTAGTLVAGGGENNFATDGAIKGSVAVRSGATLKLGQSEVVANSSLVTVNAGGVLDVNGFSETIGSLSSGGSVLVSAGQRLAMDLFAGAASTFSGVVSGAGTLQLRGANAPGTLTLTGTNTFSGGLIIGGNNANNPTLVTGTIGNGGVAGPLGQASANPSNLQFDDGTLSYTGISATSNRGALFTHHGTIDVGSSATNLTLTGPLVATPSGDATPHWLGKSGFGTLTLAGSDDNTGVGAAVSRGKLVLAKNSGPSVHAIDGTEDALFISIGATAQLAGTGDDQIPSTASVRVDGIIDLNGHNEGFAGLSGFAPGSIRNTALGTLSTVTVGQANSSSVFNGGITETGAGTIALVKTGTGTLELAGGKSYTGGTTVNEGNLLITRTGHAGVLLVNGSGTLLSDQMLGPITVGAGGALSPGSVAGIRSIGKLTASSIAFGSGDTFAQFDLANSTSGSGLNDLIQATGNLNLGGVTKISISGGAGGLANGTYTLFTYGGALSGNESNVAIAEPQNYRQTFTFLPTASTSGSLQMSVAGVAGNLVWKGDGLANVWDVNGRLNWNGGTERFLQLDSVTFEDTGSTSPAVVLTGVLNPAIVMVNNTATAYTFTGAGSLSGGTTLIKSGTGALSVSNTNTHTGGTLVNGGILKLENSAALGAGNVAVADGGTVDLNGFPLNKASIAFVIGGSGAAGRGALVNNGAAEIQSPNGISALTLSSDATIGGTARWDVNSSAVVNGGIFTLTKTGLNDVWWGSSATSTLGTLVVDQGRFVTRSASNNLGSNTFSVFVAGGAELSTFGNLSQSKPVVLNGGRLGNEGPGTSTWNGTVTLQGAGTSNQFRAAGRIDIAGKITGPGDFEKIGVQTLNLLNAANDYTGDTVIEEGTLSFLGQGKLPLATALIVNATLDLQSTNQSVASLAGTGRIIGNGVASATLTVFQSVETAFSGTMDQLLLIKDGAGTLTLFGADTQGPALQVQRGLLVLGNTAVQASIDADGTLRLSGAGGKQISDSGANVVNGVLDFNGRSETLRSLDGSGVVTNSAAGTLSTLIIRGIDRDSTFAGTIENGAGELALTKITGGTLLLAGINTYTGPTLLNFGGITVTGSITASQTTVTGGTLSGNGSFGSVTVSGDILSSLCVIAPGPGPELGKVGTMSIGALALDSSQTPLRLQFDLAGSTTRGAGVNDLISVAGNLSFTGTHQIAVALRDAYLVTGNYTLLTYGGALSGSNANLSLSGIPTTTRQSFALDATGTPGEVLLRVTGNRASLTWVGDGNGGTDPDTWNLSNAANWSGGEQFFNLDDVTFDDTGAATSPKVVITTNVAPARVSVINSLGHDYTFTGNGYLSGDATLTKRGTGTLYLNLSGVSTYVGGTLISQGTIMTSKLTNLGTGLVTLGDSETGVEDVALLQTGSGSSRFVLNPEIVVSANGTGAVTIGATATNAGASYYFTYPITLNRPTTLLHSGLGDSVFYDNPIAGPVGTLTIAGGRRTTLSYTNTFTGNVVVVGSGTILDLTVTYPDHIPDASNVDLGAGTEMRTTSETINALTGSGTVTSGNWVIGANNGSGTFAGSFTGISTVRKAGSGAETLSGSSTTTGTMSVDKGTLNVSGSVAGSMFVNSGGTLAGTGTLGAVTLNSGGHIAPGIGIGTMSLGGLTWSGGGVVDFELGQGSTSDLLDLGSGALAKGFSGTLSFDFQNTGEENTTYTLLTFGSTSLTASDFSYSNLAPGLTGIFQVASGAVKLTTIPEPGSVALLLVGFGMAARRSSGRRRLLTGTLSATNA